MGLTYLVLLLCALIIFNWRFIGLDRVFGGGDGGGRRPCRWSRTAEATSDAPAAWRCEACGAEVGTTDGRQPSRCVARG